MSRCVTYPRQVIFRCPKERQGQALARRAKAPAKTVCQGRTFWWTGLKRVRNGQHVRNRSPLTPKEQFMARFLPNEDPFTLEDQLKILGNDELLDFWEESQMLDRYLEPAEHEEPPSMHYENAILNELRLRHSMGEI